MKKLSFNKLSGSSQRPPLEGLYAYILAVLMGYGVADLTVTSFRGDMLPSEPPPKKAKKRKTQKFQLKSDYRIITQRNIFNSDGEIPPALSEADKTGNEIKSDAPAVPSQLPLDLLGTLVHFDPNRSIATIKNKGRNITSAYKVGDDMEGMGVILEVERKRVVFRNSNNGRREYIEIPEDIKISFGVNNKPLTGSNELVKKTSEFDFNLKRDDVLKYTSNLSGILNQARMIPNRPPGGEVEGFRFTSIKPGSVFEKLGFKPNDVIKGVNGEDVNSPTKAMELFNALKTSDEIELKVERNGREEKFRYSID